MRAAFGPFSFDLCALELSRNGIRLRLEEKPARFLACLIERRGGIVTREELRRRLWPEQVNVDFDHGLNKAANKLRAVLGDSSVTLTYLETLSKRGYRFIGCVELEPTGQILPEASSAPELDEPAKATNALESPRARATNPADESEVVATRRTAPLPVHPSVLARWSAPALSLKTAVFLGISAALLSALIIATRDFPPKEAPETSNKNLLPQSAEAALLFSNGMTLLQESNSVDARVLFDRAIAIEPEHALSHAGLSRAFLQLGFSADAEREAERAVALAKTLPSEQRLLLEAQLSETRFEWDKAIEIYRSLFLLSPRSVRYGLRLAYTEILAGKSIMAIATLKQLRQLKLKPDSDLQVDLAETEAVSAISDFRRQREVSAQMAEKARGLGNNNELAWALLNEGEAQRALGNLSEALALWEEAAGSFAAIGDRGAIIRIRIDEGRTFWQKGDLARAEEAYDEALASSKEIGYKTGEGRALTGLGQIRMFQLGGESGRKLCEDALSIFREIGNRQEEAYTLSLIADTVATHHSEAKELYERSLELSREVNDRSRVAGRLMDLGIMETVQGDLAAAERNLQESLRIYREIGERNREALQLTNLAIVYKWQGRLEEAESLVQKAVAILDEIGETNVRGQARQNLALIQMEAGKLNDAEKSIRLAIVDHHQGNDPGSVSLSKSVLAQVLAIEGKLAEAQQTLEEANEIVHWSRPIGENLAFDALTRARLNAGKGRFMDAKREARRASSLALSMDEGSMYMKALLVSGEIELQSGNQATGQQQLERLAREASGKGFGLIAVQARKALTIEHAQLGWSALPHETAGVNLFAFGRKP